MILKTKKILISCGGTGGHIFPAIEIAKSLKKKNKDIDVLFVGAYNKMEMIKVPKEGFSIIGLWLQGFYRKSIISCKNKAKINDFGRFFLVGGRTAVRSLQV